MPAPSKVMVETETELENELVSLRLKICLAREESYHCPLPCEGDCLLPASNSGGRDPLYLLGVPPSRVNRYGIPKYSIISSVLPQVVKRGERTRTSK